MPATSANALAAHKDAFLSILPPFFVLGWRPIDRCKYIARHDYRRKRYSITAEAAFHPLSFVGIIQTRHQTPPGDLTRLNERRLLNATILLRGRSAEHTSELQSLMRISYAVFCLNK